MPRSYAYRAPIRRAKRTTCPECGGKMGPQSSDPSDRLFLCNNSACPTTRQVDAGGRCEPHITF